MCDKLTLLIINHSFFLNRWGGEKLIGQTYAEIEYYTITIHVLSHLLPQEEARVEASGSGSQSMDRLVDLLNSMRSNSSGVEQQLASFMEEAQCSARSEETLAQVVSTIYSKAVSDRSFAATAAKLCDKMALFMVEGTKFRSLLLNMLQVRAPGQLQVQQRRGVIPSSKFSLFL